MQLDSWIIRQPLAPLFIFLHPFETTLSTYRNCDSMSTPGARRPLHGDSQDPATPTSLPSPLGRGSVPVEPKSEYLRHALDAKRAKQASPSPTPPEARPPPPTTTLNKAPSDPWLDQAKCEGDGPHITAMRRHRRPSDGAVPRPKTQRELQAEMEKLKETIFNLNMKLELIRKQNNDLKDQMEEAQKRVDELEPLGDENFELREENIQLQQTNDTLASKIQEMAEELIELRQRNTKILQIQDESLTHMESQNTALEEAAEIIIRLEDEKNALAQENSNLKDQVATLQTTPTAETYAETDGDAKERCPCRVYSIDESRPSTSHFDSDYYSQPGSPQAKPSKDPLSPVTVSERARSFLAMNKEAARSVQDLKKRSSDASMKGIKPKISIPEVPQIPEAYKQAQTPKTLARQPRRSKLISPTSPALAPDSYVGMQRSPTPRTPTSPAEGLRGLFREGMTLDASVRSNQRSSSGSNSPLETRRMKPSREGDRPTAPVRGSSRHAQTASSAEKLRADTVSETASEARPDQEWATMPSPPSVISEDLTTEPEIICRARWWQGLDKLNNPQRGRAFFPSSARDGARTTSGSLGTPYMEQNFMFNPGENVDQFMRKAMPNRRDR